jgi:hypothetical protein
LGWAPAERKKQMTLRLNDEFTGKRASHDA